MTGLVLKGITKRAVVVYNARHRAAGAKWCPCGSPIWRANPHADQRIGHTSRDAPIFERRERARNVPTFTVYVKGHRGGPLYEDGITGGAA